MNSYIAAWWCVSNRRVKSVPNVCRFWKCSGRSFYNQGSSSAKLYGDPGMALLATISGARSM